MAKEFFRNWQPRGETINLVAQCIVIAQDYMAQGYKLTLRQLYYQLVSRDIIPNTEKSYKKLSSYCSRARMAGLMDWDAIEDRARRPHKHPQYDDLSDLVNAALYSYRLDRWQGQEEHVELWVEKDALTSILQPIADEYHITLMVNRGYSSASAMKQSAERLRDYADTMDTTILYLGDLDPSGEDMVRDIRDRLYEFGVDVDVRKVALTYDQVVEYGPPPNPAKVTDPRAGEYIRQYGRSSWEVDALTPAVLTELITAELVEFVDRKKMKAIEQQEEMDKLALGEAVKEIMGA